MGYRHDEESINTKLIINLFVSDFELVKKLTISKQQLEIIQLCPSGFRTGLTACGLAKKRNITVQNASTQLAKLYKKGYLTRFERVDKSGGIYLEYNS